MKRVEELRNIISNLSDNDNDNISNRSGNDNSSVKVNKEEFQRPNTTPTPEQQELSTYYLSALEDDSEEQGEEHPFKYDFKHLQMYLDDWYQRGINEALLFIERAIHDDYTKFMAIFQKHPIAMASENVAKPVNDLIRSSLQKIRTALVERIEKRAIQYIDPEAKGFLVYNSKDLNIYIQDYNNDILAAETYIIHAIKNDLEIFLKTFDSLALNKIIMMKLLDLLIANIDSTQIETVPKLLYRKKLLDANQKNDTQHYRETLNEINSAGLLDQVFTQAAYINKAGLIKVEPETLNNFCKALPLEKKSVELIESLAEELFFETLGSSLITEIRTKELEIKAETEAKQAPESIVQLNLELKKLELKLDRILSSLSDLAEHRTRIQTELSKSSQNLTTTISTRTETTTTTTYSTMTPIKNEYIDIDYYRHSLSMDRDALLNLAWKFNRKRFIELFNCELTALEKPITVAREEHYRKLIVSQDMISLKNYDSSLAAVNIAFKEAGLKEVPPPKTINETPQKSPTLFFSLGGTDDKKDINKNIDKTDENKGFKLKNFFSKTPEKQPERKSEEQSPFQKFFSFATPTSPSKTVITPESSPQQNNGNSASNKLTSFFKDLLPPQPATRNDSNNASANFGYNEDETANNL